MDRFDSFRAIVLISQPTMTVRSEGTHPITAQYV
jgi:hypothetical protein